MSKEELIGELADIRSSFVNDITMKLSNLLKTNLMNSCQNIMVHSELQQCKKFNFHLLTRTIQLEHNAVTNSQYSRRETIELNPVLADITEDVLEENIYKALHLTEVNVAPNNLHTCHQMKRSDRVIVKFKCRKQKILLCINMKI